MFALNGNKPIWVRDNEHGFLLGKISDIGSDNVTVQLNDSRKVSERSRPCDRTERDPSDVLSRHWWSTTIRYFKRKNMTKMWTIIVRSDRRSMSHVSRSS